MDINKVKNITRIWGGTKWDRMNWKDVELISLHIPKTAGTSLYNTLLSEYTPAGVTRIDLNDNGCRVNMVPHEKAYISKHTRVIHGHFTYSELNEKIDLNSDIPIITWLRDPVERVISNYFYLSKILREKMAKGNEHIRPLPRMQKTLVEYAKQDGSRNRITKFLHGVPLEKFHFIGFVEQYEDDLQKLADLLNWKNHKYVKVNITGKTNKYDVTVEERNTIRELNMQDVELYEKAKSLFSH